MFSAADKIKGQGVGSAYEEQVNLVKSGLKDSYEIYLNTLKKCDIIHFHTINPEYWLSTKLDRDFFAHVGYVHFLPETVEDSLDIPEFGKKIFYKYIIDFYNRMDYLVTVNPYFIGELEKYGIPRQKITYIPNFVSNKNFYPMNPDELYKIKTEYGIDVDKFIILGVGQLQSRKGVIDFVKTAQQFPEAQFIWAGGFSFGIMTDGYKELKEVMENPPKNVKFLGIVEREKMNEIYNISDVLFLPSYSELFPMTVLESMCVGKPIVLRDLDIYPQILFDYYLKGSSVEDFTKILKKLEAEPEFYNFYKNKAFEGNSFYSQENILRQWKAFYDKVYTESKAKQKHFQKNKSKINISHKGKIKKVHFKNSFNSIKRNFFSSFLKVKNIIK